MPAVLPTVVRRGPMPIIFVGALRPTVVNTVGSTVGNSVGNTIGNTVGITTPFSAHHPVKVGFPKLVDRTWCTTRYNLCGCREGTASLLIRKHDHITPARQMRRDVRALTARNHPQGRFVSMSRHSLHVDRLHPSSREAPRLAVWRGDRLPNPATLWQIATIKFRNIRKCDLSR